MSYQNRLKALALGTCLIGGTAFAGASEAQNLRYALGFPPGSDAAKGAEIYADTVNELTNGELNVRVFPLSLLNFAETSGGLRDGIADIGYLLAPYFPSEYPHYNMIAEASMVQTLLDTDSATATMAYVGAMTEYAFTRCPECLEDFKQQNQIFTGSQASSPYILHCADEPVTSLSDIRGKRLRVAGAHWSRWSQHVGASPVTLSANELYESLSQGVVDCVVVSLPELTNLQFIDAVDHITKLVPGGSFAGTAATNFNRDSWQSLSESHREAALRAGAVSTAYIPFTYVRRDAEVLDLARDRGIEVHEPDADLIEATEKFIRQDIETMASHYADNHGVQRGEEILTEFRELLDRWVQLVEGIDNYEALAELYWEEAFSKVDVSSYGMD